MQSIKAKISRIEAIKLEGIDMDIEPIGMAVKPKGIAIYTTMEVEIPLAMCTTIYIPIPKVDAAICTAVYTGVAKAEAGEVTIKVEPMEGEPKGYKAKANLVNYINLASYADTIMDLLTNSLTIMDLDKEDPMDDY